MESLNCISLTPDFVLHAELLDVKIDIRLGVASMVGELEVIHDPLMVAPILRVW